jgi:iron(III) transport system permease protein
MLASPLLIRAQTIREYAPALFLAEAESQVIGTTAIDLGAQGGTGSVAALATLQIAVVAGLAGLLLRIALTRALWLSEMPRRTQLNPPSRR